MKNSLIRTLPVLLLAGATLAAAQTALPGGRPSTTNSSSNATSGSTGTGAVSTPSMTMSMPMKMKTPSMTMSTPSGMAKVNVNTATLAQLEKAGLSMLVAQEVIKNRPYTNQGELFRKVPALASGSMLKMRSMFMY